MVANLEALRVRLALHVLTDRDWSRGRPTVDVARAALTGGATVIQLRDKRASTRVLVEEGLALRALTRQFGALLIVNDRIDVALAVDADGVHLGQDDLPVALARTLLGPERLLGVSAGNLHEAELAVKGGADYLGVGPIYATSTKADAGEPTGLQVLTDIAAHYALPLVAIGGITVHNAHEVRQAGASGVAVITAVVNAEDIAAAAHVILSALRKEL